MRRMPVALLAASLAIPLASAPRIAAAQPLEAGGGACGGNAYSSAEVTEGRGRRRGPLTAVPDTLCADIETGRPPLRLDLYAAPGRDGSAAGLGGRDRSAPYERAFRPGPEAD